MKAKDAGVLHSGWAARFTVCKQVSQSEVVLDTFCSYFGEGGSHLIKLACRLPLVLRA